MEYFKKILFPVDLSEVSPKLVPYVKEMAATFDAEVHLLFVARILQHFTSIYVPHPSVNKFESEVVEGAEKKLQEFVEEHLNYAQAEGIDLIIIGTHGRKGLERIIFGSVAERVLKKSQVPVLTVNPHRRPIE